jgi:chaperone required for assembly of F1-ATPase
VDAPAPNTLMLPVPEGAEIVHIEWDAHRAYVRWHPIGDAGADDDTR